MFPAVNFACLMILVLGSKCNGLYFSMDRSFDGNRCGPLQCTANKTLNIVSIYELSIYNVTQAKTQDKLATVSLSHQQPDVDLSKINAINVTGAISGFLAELAIWFTQEQDCSRGSFLCELDFVNISGQSEVVREVLYPRTNPNGSSDLLVELFNRLNKLTVDNEWQHALLRNQAEVTETKLEALEVKVDRVISQLSRIEAFLNSSKDSPALCSNNQSDEVKLSGCYKGKPFNSSRERFLLWGNKPALCDSETDGGGWIIIQRRTSGDVSFDKEWEDYKRGFGTPDTDFWIGNDIIHNLTSQGYTDLFVDMRFRGHQYFATYKNFTVADDAMQYQISLGKFKGNASDGMAYNNKMYFSTPYRDNDRSASKNCAEEEHAGWWYGDCSYSLLNGRWFWMGVYWASRDDNMLAPDFVEMKVRLST